uniref:Uncharacterized protein n=1 Tax=Nothobranchius kuhntae TaxID=321403 RepID=A0A1A8KLD9_NOTKU
MPRTLSQPLLQMSRTLPRTVKATTFMGQRALKSKRADLTPPGASGWKQPPCVTQTPLKAGILEATAFHVISLDTKVFVSTSAYLGVHEPVTLTEDNGTAGLL